MNVQVGDVIKLENNQFVTVSTFVFALQGNSTNPSAKQMSQLAEL